MPLTKRLIKGSTLSYQEMDTNLDEMLGSVDSIAALKAYPTAGLVDKEPLYVKGYYAAGDGGDGAFYWDATSVETPIDGMIVQSTGVATGRWKRIFSGIVSVKWFGAKGDGSNSDTPVQAAVTYCKTNGDALYWPYGNYPTTVSIDDLHLIRHVGNGWITRGSDVFYVDQTVGQDNVLYVSTVGLSTNDGLSSSEPMLTIQEGVDVWEKYANGDGGWTIELAAGTYDEGAVIDGIAASNELVINGVSKATTIIDGTTAVNATGLNFNGDVRGRVKNITVQDFTSSLIAFQNGAVGVIDTCDGNGVTNFGFNASERGDMNIVGVCTMNVGLGGRGVRYYRNSTGSIGNGTDTITLDGGGNVADGFDIRNGSEVVCNDGIVINNFANNGILVRNGGFLELKTATISNCDTGIQVDDLSRYAEAGPVTYTANTLDELYLGFGIKQGKPKNTIIGDDGETGETPDSGYDLLIENDGTSGIQAMLNGNSFRIDANGTERILFDAANSRLRFYGNAVEVFQVRDAPAAGDTAALLLVNDGVTTSLRRINVGAADSGGTGQRLLTVDN